MAVVDLTMPRMGGRELAVRLANRVPSIKLVFITGYPELSLERDLPGRVFLKPYSPDLFVKCIGALLREVGEG